MKYSYILLDIDGTLIDFYKSYHAAGENVLKYANCTPTVSNMEVYLQCNDNAWAALDVDNVDNPYIRTHYHELYKRYIVNAAEESRKLLNLSKSTEELSEAYIYQWGKCAIPSPNAIKTCQILSNTHTLVTASNGLTDLQISKMNSFTPYISRHFISEDINHIKPEKEFFEYIINRLHCSPAECIMVGDSLKNDIEGAFKCGISTCFYNPSGQSINTGIKPDYEINNFSQLLQIVEN